MQKTTVGSISKRDISSLALEGFNY